MAKETWNFEIGGVVTIPSYLQGLYEDQVIIGKTWKITNEATNEKGQKTYELQNGDHEINLPWYLLRKHQANSLPIQQTGKQNQ